MRNFTEIEGIFSIAENFRETTAPNDRLSARVRPLWPKEIYAGSRGRPAENFALNWQIRNILQVIYSLSVFFPGFSTTSPCLPIVLVFFLFTALPKDYVQVAVQVPRIARWFPVTARLSSLS